MDMTKLVRIRNGLLFACLLGLALLALSLAGVLLMVPAGTEAFHAWSVTWDAHGTVLLVGNFIGFVYGYRRNSRRSLAD